MTSLRSLGVAMVGVAVVLLVLGFVLSNDVLGFLFAACLVVGVVALVTDSVRRRARHNAA